MADHPIQENCVRVLVRASVDSTGALQSTISTQSLESGDAAIPVTPNTLFARITIRWSESAGSDVAAAVSAALAEFHGLASWPAVAGALATLPVTVMASPYRHHAVAGGQPPLAALHLVFRADGTLAGEAVTATWARAELWILDAENGELLKIYGGTLPPQLERKQQRILTARSSTAELTVIAEDIPFSLAVVFGLGGEKRWVGPMVPVSSLTPGLLLRPGCYPSAALMDPRLIQWDAPAEGGDGVELVLVVLSAPGLSIPTVSFSSFNAQNLICRSALFPAEVPVSFTWIAYYYYQSGAFAAISGVVTAVQYQAVIVLPPNTNAVAAAGSSSFSPFSTAPSNALSPEAIAIAFA